MRKSASRIQLVISAFIAAPGTADNVSYKSGLALRVIQISGRRWRSSTRCFFSHVSKK